MTKPPGRSARASAARGRRPARAGTDPLWRLGEEGSGGRFLTGASAGWNPEARTLTLIVARRVRRPDPAAALLVIASFAEVGDATDLLVRVRFPSLSLREPYLQAGLAVGWEEGLDSLAALLRPTAEGILANLSLLFVPAGVGVVGHISTLGSQTLSLLLAVVVSTVLAIAAGAGAFVLVARLTGAGDE